MIKHIVKLVWNRKRANALVAIEIGIAFLVLFAVVAITAYSLDNYSRSLGFSYEGVWNVKIDRDGGTDDQWTPEAERSIARLLTAAGDLPEVESAAAVNAPPYSGSHSISAYELKGRTIEFEMTDVTDNFKDVMKIPLVSGRWFSREDNGSKYRPVVINQSLARLLFGADDPIGRSLRETAPGEKDERIVGVVSAFRKDGEYSGPANFVFYRTTLDDPTMRPPSNLVLRLREGTSREFEGTLAAALQNVARGFSYEIQPLAEMRASNNALYRVPVIVVSLVAGFLMIMVGLGLTGVLWQNVTQRTREIGLRRAKGATARDIYMQILGELFVITSLGVAVGTVVAIQFPLLNLIESVSVSVYGWSFLVSLLAIYALTMLCGLYPSWMASRIQPAEALHYE